MANVVSLKNYNRSSAKMSKVNLDMTRAFVAAIKLADEKRMAQAQEVNLEKTVSNERR